MESLKFNWITWIKYYSVKILPDIIKDLKKHVTSFTNYHCGSDVFFSESGDKFKIGGKILMFSKSRKVF